MDQAAQNSIWEHYYDEPIESFDLAIRDSGSWLSGSDRFAGF